MNEHLKIETASPLITPTMQPNLYRDSNQGIVTPNQPAATMGDVAHPTTVTNLNLNEFMKQKTAIPTNESTLRCDSQPTTADEKRPTWSAKTILRRMRAVCA